jgi:ribosomal protein S18 acetylase RimI-like enzyme
VVQFRHFRNTDPPSLVVIWNECFTGRGAVRLRHSTPLEYHVFSKPYFDPAGLILAEENGTAIGFVHAAFGPSADGSSLSEAVGVICVLGVRPAWRRRGIGTELLRRAEAYLQQRGATSLVAGPLPPLAPFYLGLYGGSSPAGFLASEADAEPFFTKHGYCPANSVQVFQRRLDKAVSLGDARFMALRNRFELRVEPRKRVGRWYQEAALGLIEPFDFRLEEKPSGQVSAELSVWEMEGFSWRWNQPSVGLFEIAVRPDLRRQGLARFLLAQLMRYLQDQFFGILEAHVPQGNEPAANLLRGMGFEPVDTGRNYQRNEKQAAP